MQSQTIVPQANLLLLQLLLLVFG